MMCLLFWDASALNKRYFAEVGSDTVDALFSPAHSVRMLSTYGVYVEGVAALLRRRNVGSITKKEFQSSFDLLRDEVLLGSGFTLLETDTSLVLSSVDYVLRHNLNSSDAAILATFLKFAQAQPADSPPCIFVASDLRLLRAASAEGLATLNPELLPADDVPTFLEAHAKNGQGA